MKTKILTSFVTLSLLFIISTSCSAWQIDLSTRTITGPDGQRITAATDNNLDTVWSSGTNQLPGMAVTIDLGRPTSVDRIFLTPGSHVSGYPRGLQVSIGNALDQMTIVPTSQEAELIETDLRFDPVIGRYLRLSLTGEGAGYPWVIAEMMVWGSSSPQALAPTDCVVLEKDTWTLRLAAQELSYYVGELTGAPIPIVDATHADHFTGTIYRIASPPVFPPYAQFVDDPRSNDIETGSVIRKGREVLFSGGSELGELYGVYEFLDRNGVHWVFPHALGDSVPEGKGVDLTVLPIVTKPSFESRTANWDTQNYIGDTYLWLFRNRWDVGWGGGGKININNRPGVPTPNKSPARFGTTESMLRVIDYSQYKDHPDWLPYFRTDSPHADRISGVGAWHKQTLGQRVPFNTTYGLNFCTSNDGVVQYVSKQIEDWSDPVNLRAIAWLVPADAAMFCECDNCLAQNEPKQMDTDQGQLSYSNLYMTFITRIAKNIATTLPNLRIGAYGYDNYQVAPSKFKTLPDNVDVDVVQQYSYNLPLTTSVKNAYWKGAMDDWSTRWSEPGHLGIYDWLLLLGEGHAGKIPVPCVTALTDSTRYLYHLGARRIGTQGLEDIQSWRSNPWNYYAYSRLNWNVNEPAPKILGDFFSGYYHEASEPMLDYYNTLESYLIKHDIPLVTKLNFNLPPAFFSLPVLTHMDSDLTAAEHDAKSWYVVQRVKDAREGFDAILKRLCLTQIDWRNPACFVPVGARDAIWTLVPGKERIDVWGYPVGAPNKDGSYGVFSWWRIGDYVNVTVPGTYRVTLRLKSNKPTPIPIGVNIGANRVILQLPPTGLGDYSVDIPVSQTGVQEVSFQDLKNQNYQFYSMKLVRLAP